MRDILVLIVVAATIPLAFYRPFYGLLGFSWLAYMRPQDLAWGLAASFPLSKIVALAIWVSLILRGNLNVFRRTPVTLAMLGLWVWLLVSVLAAQHRDVALEKFTDISKVFLIAFLTVVLVTDKKRFKISMAVIGVSLGLLGLKFGLFGVLRGGVHFTRGVGGMIGDNNDFALALNMSLPFLVFLATSLDSRWVRWAAGVMIPLTVLTILFTQSRGGFLALAAVTLYLVLRSKQRFVAVAVVALVALVGSQFVPESFYERIGSIVNYQEDSSAMGRLNAWQASVHMANDYPVFGVGLDNFMYLFRYYAPDPEQARVAHNTYLQILAEAGYVGLLLYLGLLGTSFWTFESVRRRASRHDMDWAVSGSTYLMGSLVAFVVGGVFLNRAHFDLTYHVMILGCCLDRIVRFEVNALRAREEDRARVSHAA